MLTQARFTMTHPESKTMEIFKVTAALPGATAQACIAWGASQTEAATIRKRWSADDRDLVITTQTVNIPTSKGPLVEWLNANVRG